MDDGAHAAAWQRIEAALTRLDAAARAQGGAAVLAARLRQEQHRHDALREALRDTLGRMDALIAAHTPLDAHTPREDDAA